VALGRLGVATAQPSPAPSIPLPCRLHSSLSDVDGYNIYIDGGGSSAAGRRRMLGRRASEGAPGFFGDEQEQALIAQIAAVATGQAGGSQVLRGGGRQPLVVQVRRCSLLWLLRGAAGLRCWAALL
jgi:hypothetical protein